MRHRSTFSKGDRVRYQGDLGPRVGEGTVDHAHWLSGRGDLVCVHWDAAPPWADPTSRFARFSGVCPSKLERV